MTLACAVAGSARAEVRIKDITEIEGVRVNQLVGMGLVTGLIGTGSKSPVTRQYAINFMQRMGMRVDPSVRLQLQTDTTQKTNNLSVVTVTADLPAFARRGSRIDVLVSTFDDAASLEGGQLIMTPLFAANGQVYAVASGPVSTGGFSFGGQAATVQKNFPTTGRISEGATIEEETQTPLGVDGTFRLLLGQPDFETARRIANAINEEEPGIATCLDSTAVNVCVPPRYRGNTAEFAGLIGALHVVPDGPARVVINERTGTVIIGENVKISKVLITHANLAITTTEAPQVSQPAPFSEGETVVVPRTNIGVEEQQKQISYIDETVTLGELAQALNSLGVTPRDLSSILQQLKECGALHAELEFK
ncbi:flagellar P-ring protein precursor FlgI [Planctomicrobium piriforme]|uniref:Flagellar P-ring protein n=1 Tax=Planctomicrobium piriforme TaxID=1576369 RepID=A0A1I3HKW8_9PLAN|nr:flagellar P-ring protein precursor FlgI [Planctomicrobium piriforme]